MTHLFRLGFICEGSGKLSCDDSNVESPNTKEQNLQSTNLQENQASPNAEVLWYSFVPGFTFNRPFKSTMYGFRDTATTKTMLPARSCPAVPESPELKAISCSSLKGTRNGLRHRVLHRGDRRRQLPRHHRVRAKARRGRRHLQPGLLGGVQSRVPPKDLCGRRGLLRKRHRPRISGTDCIALCTNKRLDFSLNLFSGKGPDQNSCLEKGGRLRRHKGLNGYDKTTRYKSITPFKNITRDQLVQAK